jgi:hypothetical protein
MFENTGQSPVAAPRRGGNDDCGHADRPGGQHGDGSGRHRGGGVVVPVDPGARQGQKQAAGSDRARIEFDGPGDVQASRILSGDVGQLAADDRGDLGDGQVNHVRRASRAAANSIRSSNGCV